MKVAPVSEISVGYRCTLLYSALIGVASAITISTLTITISPDSDIARALDEGDAESLVLLHGGTRFRVIRESDDPWATYDPAKLRAGLKKVAGLLSPEEGERIIESIYRGREEGTRPLSHQ